MKKTVIVEKTTNTKKKNVNVMSNAAVKKCTATVKNAIAIIAEKKKIANAQGKMMTHQQMSRARITTEND